MKNIFDWLKAINTTKPDINSFEDKDWEIVKQSKVIKEENDDFFYKIVTFKKLLK